MARYIIVSADGRIVSRTILNETLVLRDRETQEQSIARDTDFQRAVVYDSDFIAPDLILSQMEEQFGVTVFPVYLERLDRGEFQRVLEQIYQINGRGGPGSRREVRELIVSANAQLGYSRVIPTPFIDTSERVRRCTNSLVEKINPEYITFRRSPIGSNPDPVLIADYKTPDGFWDTTSENLDGESVEAARRAFAVKWAVEGLMSGGAGMDRP